MGELSCPNPDCKVAETGKCVEGFEIDECPHLNDAKSDKWEEAAEIADGEDSPTESSDVFVSSGEILTIDEAADVLCMGESRVITVIGPVRSGKTTLGISLYGAFQNGPFGNWNFVGSRTLPAFEKRCHHARMESGRLKPETPRTSLAEGLGFLHLAVHNEGVGRLDLLISDRSGEFYSEASDNQEDCQVLHEVSRADYVLLLVDGKKLVTSDRHGIRSDMVLLIKAMIQSGVLGLGQRIGIVLTKYDHVKVDSDVEQTEAYFDDLVSRIADMFGQELAGVKSFRIAARPENNSVPQLYGVLEVLEECLCINKLTKYEPLQGPSLDRYYFRLKMLMEDES